MSIPLVQNNEKDSINTSIIAIKRQIERINALLGLSNSEEIDTSVFATKDELQQAVTDLQPVDEVTADNMQSVTSNAVYEVTKNIDSWLGDFGVDCFKIGRIVLFKLRKNLNQASPAVIGYIPERFRPYSINIRFVFLNNNNDEPCGQGIIDTDGKISLYHQNGANLNGAYYADIVYFAND